ncbi:MAG: NUDIX hydrolase [Bacteroidetes bacterium]|nr:NUDIX hydrolase [Bacteroidota bacterium]
MGLKRWKKISEQLVYTNNWWKYKRDEFLLPNGKRGEYHYVFTNGASMIVPLFPDGQLLFVKQYRYLNDRESLEFPCGGVKDGQTYEETAIHELAEEAGYKAGKMEYIGSFNPYNGVTNEICRIYLATELEPVSSTPDETEEFEKIVLFPNEIDRKIAEGEIWDGMTIATWSIIKVRRVIELLDFLS